MPPISKHWRFGLIALAIAGAGLLIARAWVDQARFKRRANAGFTELQARHTRVDQVSATLDQEVRVLRADVEYGPQFERLTVEARLHTDEPGPVRIVWTYRPRSSASRVKEAVIAGDFPAGDSSIVIRFLGSDFDRPLVWARPRAGFKGDSSWVTGWKARLEVMTRVPIGVTSAGDTFWGDNQGQALELPGFVDVTPARR
jgi:hypothetical protein